MVSVTDLPAAAILRDDSGRALVWRHGVLVAPEPPTTITALLGSSLADAREWFDGAAGEPLHLTSVAITAPVDRQDVWGAGITYERSLDARAGESGRDAMYDHVYRAHRPEIFYKAAGPAVAGWGGTVAVRSDSAWTVPEPELAVLADGQGEIYAYGIGCDVTARDIEGENPLYLPQAKTYDGSCAIGPAAVPVWEVEPGMINMFVTRDGETVFTGSVSPTAMVRPLVDLVRWVVSWHRCGDGLWLLTGTGIVPPDDFKLRPGDEVAISIEGLGTLRNTVGVTGPTEGR